MQSRNIQKLYNVLICIAWIYHHFQHLCLLSVYRSFPIYIRRLKTSRDPVQLSAIASSLDITASWAMTSSVWHWLAAEPCADHIRGRKPGPGDNAAPFTASQAQTSLVICYNVQLWSSAHRALPKLDTVLFVSHCGLITKSQCCLQQNYLVRQRSYVL